MSETVLPAGGLLDGQGGEKSRNRAKLWCFLQSLRQVEPAVLTSLADEVLPIFRGRPPEKWMAVWSWSAFLPETPLLVREVENTLLTSDDTLTGTEPLWAFEWVFKMSRAHPAGVLGSSPVVSLDLRLPSVPAPGARDSAWRWWESEAAKTASSQIHGLALLLRGNWGAYHAWEILKEERSSLRRHVHWLAMKQATGESYAQLAREISLSGDCQKRGVEGGGVRRGVLKAATEIGLHHSRIRSR